MMLTYYISFKCSKPDVKRKDTRDWNGEKFAAICQSTDVVEIK